MLRSVRNKKSEIQSDMIPPAKRANSSNDKVICVDDIVAVTGSSSSRRDAGGDNKDFSNQFDLCASISFNKVDAPPGVQVGVCISPSNGKGRDSSSAYQRTDPREASSCDSVDKEHVLPDENELERGLNCDKMSDLNNTLRESADGQS